MKFIDFKNKFEPTYTLNIKTCQSFFLETTKDIPKEYKKREISFTDTVMKLHWNGKSWTVSKYYSNELKKFNVNDGKIISNIENTVVNNKDDDIIVNNIIDKNSNMPDIIVDSIVYAALITPILSAIISK
jgi:hypothetical protein